jgi:hypothetical protein
MQRQSRFFVHPVAVIPTNAKVSNRQWGHKEMSRDWPVPVANVIKRRQQEGHCAL